MRITAFASPEKARRVAAPFQGPAAPHPQVRLTGAPVAGGKAYRFLYGDSDSRPNPEPSLSAPIGEPTLCEQVLS